MLKFALFLLAVAVGTTVAGIGLSNASSAAMVQASSMILLAAAGCWITSIGLLVAAAIQSLIS